jgi:hypothetical protein
MPICWTGRGRMYDNYMIYIAGSFDCIHTLSWIEFGMICATMGSMLIGDGRSSKTVPVITQVIPSRLNP